MGEQLRTCVGCRSTAPKRDLIRLVSWSGGIAPDPTMTKPGRGAYVHRDPACVEAAVGRGALARALRVRIGPEEASNLLREILRSLEQE